MALQTPADREFAIQPRGYIRDRVILANFREGLRGLTNPETGTAFTEEQIQRATQPRTRWYNEAQAIDDFGQSEQRRALFLADQLRIERASSGWLIDFHGAMWGEGFLDPTGGSGSVRVPGVPFTLITGSTTPDDPAAYKARDSAGNRYQVMIGGTIGTGGTGDVTMMALDTGAATNKVEGEILTWTFRDPNMQPTATVLTDFGGGTDRETDAEFAARLLGIIRHKQGAGNDSQTRGWTRRSSNAIEDAFVYPCAFHAGSVMIAITQKRATQVGPLARLPSPSTLAAAIGYMTPPASPVYPVPPHVLVVGVQSQTSDLVLRIDQAKASRSGWTDATPFPSYHATTPTVTNVVTPGLVFDVTCPGDATLPGQLALATVTGSSAPKLMVWDAVHSSFVSLAPTSVQDLGSNVYRVTLPAPLSVPGYTLAVNDVVSPDAGRRAIISSAFKSYFDSLGPREVIDLANDARGARCVRFPYANEERPYRAGATVVTRVLEGLGGASADAVLSSISRTEPDLPAVLTNGPNMLTLGTAGVYAL